MDITVHVEFFKQEINILDNVGKLKNRMGFKITY